MFEIPNARPKVKTTVLADWIEAEVLLGDGQVLLEEIADLLHSDPGDFSVSDENIGASRDKQYEEAESAFFELKSRFNWLGKSYPLLVDNDVAMISHNFSCYRLYSFLVGLRARQMYGGDAYENPEEPSAIFEEIVTEAARQYVCGSSNSRARFGIASRRNHRLYRGDNLPRKFPAAVIELSKRLSEEVVPTVQGVGDGGVDAVGWRPFGDRRPGQVVFMVQATIGEGDWKNKPVPDEWRTGQYLHFVENPLTGSAFVESLSLYDDAELRGVRCGIPLDRLRIIRLIDDSTFSTEWIQRMEAWTRWITERLPQS